MASVVKLKTDTLKICTDRLNLLEDDTSHPHLLKNSHFSFMKKDIKFDFDSVWEREEKEETTSIAFCPGIINLIKLGVVIPSWADFLIKVSPDGNFEWRSPDNHFQVHSHGVRGEGQFNGFKKDYVNLKFINPWVFNGDLYSKPAPFIFMHPWLHEEERWEVAEGVQTPWHGQQININIFIKIPEKETKKIFIRQGTPLCYLIPLQGLWDKVEISNKEEIDPSFTAHFSRLSFSNWKRFLIRGEK